jgi:hypothetical protein
MKKKINKNLIFFKSEKNEKMSRYLIGDLKFSSLLYSVYLPFLQRDSADQRRKARNAREYLNELGMITAVTLD